jgi:hypothetical protein
MTTPSTVYILESWDTVHHRWCERGRWTNRERASITFHKPYWRPITRRLVKQSRSLDLTAKGSR